MKAVILAGGLGTRLRPFTDLNPKPMYPFEGKPFLEHLILQIKGFGIHQILILLGYLPEKVMDYFKDGSQWGVQIEYDITPIEYETGARLKAAKDKLSEQFLLMYCDNYCPVSFDKLKASFFNCSDTMIQVTAYANQDGYTKNNMYICEDGRVSVYDKKRTQDNLNGVDIGYAIVDKSVLNFIPENNCNFETEVYPRVVEQGRLSAFVTQHRYYSVGSWERIELTKEFFKPKKIIFLDRDGTINVRPPRAEYITCPDEFIWLPGAKEAIKKLTENHYKVCLITNQPGIARKMLNQCTLDAIHEKMQNELMEIGTQIEKIYICPHGWNDGCDCRKPKPGLLYQAQKEFSLDLTKCIFLGDDERDLQAAEGADCKGILVSEGYCLKEAVQNLLEEK